MAAQEQLVALMRQLGQLDGVPGGLSAAQLDELRRKMMARNSEKFNAGGFTVEARRTQFERILSRSTDLARNRADPFGDGDQSSVQAGMPGTPGQDLIEVWSSGADFNPVEMPEGLTTLLKAAFLGDAAVVEKEVAAVRARGTEALAQALERRETLLRFTPLLSCLSGARAMASRRGADHVRVARTLLAAGARVNARDVAGYTAVMHACFYTATPVSLAILPLLLQAGGDVNHRNRAGRCALIEPTMNARNDIIQALMAAGADPRLRDNCGATAVAVGRNNPVASRLFNEYVQKHGKNEDDPPLLSVAGGALLGRRVRLTGLNARPELNGRTGVATEFSTEAERYTIKLSEGESVRVRPANLEHDVVLSAACAGCGAENARRRCSRCLTVFFCNTSCQRSNWPSHRATCAAAASLLVATVPQRAVAPLLPLPHAAGPSKPRNNGEPPREGRSFVVKVQLPHHVALRSPQGLAAFRELGLPTDDIPRNTDPEADALLIYNDDRTVMTSLPPGGNGYQSFVDSIVASGSNCQKGYFRATRAVDGTLKICFGELLPDEKW
jgi:hypothetical protein